MNELSILNTSVLTMSSREIASLVESTHSNVRISIDRLVERGVILKPAVQVLDEISNLGLPIRREVYNLQKRDSIVVVAQLSPEFTGRLVDRWQELEAAASHAPPPQLTEQQLLVDMLQCRLKLAELFKVPEHIAQQEAVKYIESKTGEDLRPLLLGAPAQNDIRPEEVMLEPADLAKAVGISSGKEVNLWLARCGLQDRLDGLWSPTTLGSPHCVKHAWQTKFKTGYNLKWSLKFIKTLLPEDWKTA